MVNKTTKGHAFTALKDQLRRETLNGQVHKYLFHLNCTIKEYRVDSIRTYHRGTLPCKEVGEVGSQGRLPEEAPLELKSDVWIEVSWTKRGTKDGGKE